MSTERKYRLADSTVVEPLVQQWSAWPQLLSPIPASLHLSNYQLPALEAYLREPLEHVRASRDPEMIGGPFVDIAPERAGEIEQLLRETLEGRDEQRQLARSVISFHNQLLEEAHGQCLEPFYERVPRELAGYVELVYDYYNRPTVRFFESLLYESRHYRSDLQSLRLWPLKRDDTRPFFMSTPRLLDEDQIDWRVTFAEPRVDELFRLDVAPQPLAYISELLGLDAADEHLLLPLLSEDDTAPSQQWDGPTARIRYFGHACVVVEWNGLSIMTDPYVGARPIEGGLERFSYGDLPAKIDYSLVTHIHQDHFALETLLRLRHRIKHLVVPKASGILYGDMSLKLMARKLGFRSVIELDPLESVGDGDVSIIGVPFLGEHGDLAHSKSGYVVRLGEQQILFGADSDCLDRQMYVNVREALGRIETVFLGTESVGAPLFWGCGPLFPIKQDRHYEQTRRYHGSNARAALEILEPVGARRIYNYAMGLEPWVEHLLGLGLTEHDPQYIESEKLIRKAHGRGLVAAERLYGKRDLYLPVSKESHVGASSEQHRYYERLLEGIEPLFGNGIRDAQYVRQTFTLNADLCASLRRLSKEFLLTAWLATLHHYTGRDEFFVCVSGDATRFLYVDLSGNPSVNALLARVAAVAERTQLDRNHHAAIQLHFELTEEGDSQFDTHENGHEFGLFLTETGHEINGTAEYNPQLLDALAVSEMIEHFQHVADVFIHHPEWRLDDALRHAAECLVTLTATETPDTEDQFAF
jgi:L-ascorbate metabolism protein UlaG (beta-lactamase superfamily)